MPSTNRLQSGYRAAHGPAEDGFQGAADTVHGPAAPTRPHLSRYRGLIATCALLFVGTLAWAWSAYDRALAHERVRVYRHVDSLTTGLAILAEYEGDDAERFRAAFETRLDLRRPLRFARVRRGDAVIAHAGPAHPMADETSPRTDAELGLMLTRTTLAASTDAPQLGPHGPPWRWSAAPDTGAAGLPLELYVGVDIGLPGPVRDRIAREIGVTLGLSWVVIIGIGIIWRRTITERALADALESSRRERARLGELNVAAAGLAHETKNPLGLILGLAQRQLADPEATAEARDVAEQIIDEADRAAARLGDFINFARLPTLAVDLVDIGQVVGDVIKTLRPDFEALDISLEDHSPCAPIPVACDRGMLEQLLVNLLLNSLHASAPGTTTAVRIEVVGAGVTLAVSDQGCGIPATMIDEVFKPYVTGRDGGHGLGLAIVKRIAGQHDWRITLTSDETGTTIAVGGLTLAEAVS